MRLGFAYSISVGVSSATNARVAPIGVYEVRVAATNDCYIVIGTNPVSTTATGTLVRAAVAGEVFSMAAGEQIAVCSGSGGGTLNVTEMTY